MLELQGKRVLVTRPHEDFPTFAQLLKAKGAIAIPFPTIEISPASETDLLKSLPKELQNFDWLILTSANGVKVLGERITDDLPPSLKLAAVGPKTADAMRQLRWRVDFVPESYLAEAILPGLGDLTGKRVLLARGDLARPGLPAGIRARGGEVIDLVIYRTRRASLDAQGVEQIRRGMDVLTFTSSSAVHNFVALMQLAQLDPSSLPGSPVFAHIGPVTAGTAQDYQLPIDLVAETHTLEGMIDSLCLFYSKKKIENR